MSCDSYWTLSTNKNDLSSLRPRANTREKASKHWTRSGPSEWVWPEHIRVCVRVPARLSTGLAHGALSPPPTPPPPPLPPPYLSSLLVCPACTCVSPRGVGRWVGIGDCIPPVHCSESTQQPERSCSCATGHVASFARTMQAMPLPFLSSRSSRRAALARPHRPAHR